MRRAFHVALPLFGAFLSLFGQTPPSQPPGAGETIKSTTQEVVVDLIIRDKKGKPVSDVTPDEVTVTDNGVKQKILSFRRVEGAEAISAAGARAPLDPLRQIRLVTLAFSDMGEVTQRQIARRAALDLIKGEQGTNVYYSVVMLSGQLYGLQPFTKDHEALQKAIERATSGVASTEFNAESERIKSQLQDTLQRATGAADMGTALRTMDATTAPAGSPALGSQALNTALVQVMYNMLHFESASSGPRLSIEALRSLVDGLSKLPGRKSVLYFTWGLQVPPEIDEMYKGLMAAANRANVTFYTVDTNGVETWSQNMGGANDLTRAAQNTARTTTRKGAVSLEEIRAADTAENSMRNNPRGRLRELAEATGGFMVGESNDLRVPLRQINEEISSYYELTYNPGIETYDGSLHRLKVEAARKDLVVHARNGYFALPPTLGSLPSLSPFELPLLTALSAATPAHDVGFRSQLLNFQPKPDGVQSAVVVEVPIQALSFREDKAAHRFDARVSVLALVKNEKGEVVRKFTRDLPIAAPADKLEGIKQGNFIYKDVATLPPGKYTLETAVMDRENGKIGVQKAPYEVAPAKGVSISNVSLVRTYQGGAKDIDPNDPFIFQGGRVTPTLNPAIKAAPGNTLAMFFVVYPDPSNKAKPSVELEYILDGQVVGKGALDLPAPDSQGRIPYVMSSAADSMPPGKYEIRATAKQGASTAETRTAIEVSK